MTSSGFGHATLGFRFDTEFFLAFYQGAVLVHPRVVAPSKVTFISKSRYLTGPTQWALVQQTIDVFVFYMSESFHLVSKLHVTHCAQVFFVDNFYIWFKQSHHFGLGYKSSFILLRWFNFNFFLIFKIKQFKVWLKFKFGKLGFLEIKG